MHYGMSGRPHALDSIDGVPINFPTANLSVTYTDFGKIKTLTEGNKSYELVYGVDNERRQSIYRVNGVVQMTKYYLGDYEEEVTPDGNIRKIHYISGDDGLSAILIRNHGSDTLYYCYTDQLGSLTALTDMYGNVVERFAYDPWGKRRNPENWAQSDSRPGHIVTRGYTMHEHVDAFNIINMNGRVYDPLTAQFFSPDPFVQAPDNWMNYNRYGYCLNNPLKYTDPSGNFIFSILCVVIPGGQALLPYVIYVDAACWGAAFNVAANWKDIKANGGFGSDKFWSYAGLGAANGLGAASGNFWIMGATGALQSGGNAFIGNDFKYTDKIWSEAAWGGATSLAFGYLTGPADKGSFLKGTKGLDLDGCLSNFIQKSGLSKTTSDLLGKAVFNFGFNYSIASVYNKFISDDPYLNENWSSEALKSAALSTAIDLGFNYVDSKSNEFKKNKVDQRQKLNNALNMYENRQNRLQIPVDHMRFYQPTAPTINPSNTFTFPELNLYKTR